MPISRIPLSQPIETRDGTLSKDSRCVNGYFETRDQKREFIKRPGLTAVNVSPSLPVQDGQGITYFNGFLYIAQNNTIYKIDPTTYARSTVGTISGTINNVYFVQTSNNNYLFLHNQTNGYLINGSTGAFSQITNDSVAAVTILTGGTGYVNPSVTFSAPTSGTTATGTVQATSGIITGITMVINGTGYTAAPTVTITDNALVVSCTNTSGTDTLTTTTAVGTHCIGANITGTGIPSGTTITNISGVTITLSQNTTSSVTSANIGPQGAGATATALLNFFPTSGLVPGACFLDSYIAVGTTSGRIYTCNVGNPTIWNPLDYITAEAEPDTSTGIAKHLNYIMNFGQWSTEFFYDAGNAIASPLSSAPSYRIEIGCANGESIVPFEQTVAWIGQSKATGLGVYLVDGTAPVKISTTYIDRILENSDLSDIYAYAFKFNGHMFYLLTLHDTNVTIVYDFNEKVWYQWTSWAADDTTGIYGEQYFRPAFFAGFGTKYFVLDHDNGNLYLLSDTAYTDAGAPIYYRAVTDIIDSGTTKRKFYNRVEIVGDKIAGTMKVRHTGDDYKTWSSYRSVDLSKGRPQIYQTGADRRRAWEFLSTDAVPLRLDAAEIDFLVGGTEEDGVVPTNYRR